MNECRACNWWNAVRLVGHSITSIVATCRALIGSTGNPYARIVRIDDIQDQSMVNKRELDELTPQEPQAAANRAQGMSQSDAYRRA